VPFIEKRFRAIPSKACRSISGLSMGGAQTIAISGTYPRMFDYIAPMSMGCKDSDYARKRLQRIRKEGYALYHLSCGREDFMWGSACNLHRMLTEEGLPHTFNPTDGGHTWSNWRRYLLTLAPLLFR